MGALSYSSQPIFELVGIVRCQWAASIHILGAETGQHGTTGTKDQHKQLEREALNIVEDGIQDMCTCARNLGCNSAQDCYVYL